MKYPVYPKWNDIKRKLNKWELIEIIDFALDRNDIILEDIIDDYIKDGFEPIGYEVAEDWYDEIYKRS